MRRPARVAAASARRWGHEGVDAWRLRGPRAALARAARQRPADSVKEIAERTHLPQPYLEQILLSVKGAGLVRSKRGVGGGYVLARPPDEITLADIVAAVEGPQLPMAEHPDHCEGHCVLQEVWVGVDEETRHVLERVTLPSSSSAPASATPKRSADHLKPSAEPARLPATMRVGARELRAVGRQRFLEPQRARRSPGDRSRASPRAGTGGRARSARAMPP